MTREIKRAVNAYNVEMQCKDCDGVMKFTGICFPVYPQKYEHKCSKCDYTESFTVVYPTIIYE